MMQLRGKLLTEDSIQSALPYKVSYSKLPHNHTLVYPAIGVFSTAGFYVHLDRHVLPYIVNIYIPTALLVVVSWIRYGWYDLGGNEACKRRGCIG